MHELLRLNLQNEPDRDAFFASYFGDEVLESLRQPFVAFQHWPKPLREALRALVIHFAQAMTEADYVVRLPSARAW